MYGTRAVIDQGKGLIAMEEEECKRRRRKYFGRVYEHFDYMVKCLRSQEMNEMELSQVEKWLLEEGKEFKRRLLEGYDELRRNESPAIEGKLNTSE